MNTQETIITRKSVRGYTEEQLTETELSTILNAAYSSPIAGTLYKTMRLTVIQNKNVLKKISNFYKEEGNMKADMLFGAPTLILVSGQKAFDDTALFCECRLYYREHPAFRMGYGAWQRVQLGGRNNASEE